MNRRLFIAGLGALTATIAAPFKAYAERRDQRLLDLLMRKTVEAERVMQAQTEQPLFDGISKSTHKWWNTKTSQQPVNIKDLEHLWTEVSNKTLCYGRTTS